MYIHVVGIERPRNEQLQQKKNRKCVENENWVCRTRHNNDVDNNDVAHVADGAN